jgi:ABC-type branched-subunit amino acid transport system substrate-binding protein
MFTSKKRLMTALTIAILIIIVIVVALSGNRSQPQSVTVGVILPLTGQYSVIGETVKNGMEMSLKTLPADDQKNIKLIFEDDKYTTKDALSAYQKLTSLDHADIIVSISSPTVEITKPEVNKAGQLMFILGDELSHDKDRVFELMPQGAGLFTSLATEAAKRYKSISIIYASDNNLFKTNSDLFKAAAPASLNVHLVPVQGNSDIRTEASQVAKSGDEAFAIFVPLETGVKILNEMKKYPTGSKPHLLCDANLALTVGQYISAVGADTFEGCISTVLADTKAPAFVSAYKSAYSSDPQFGSDFGYDAVQIISKLVKTGDKDSWVSMLNNHFTHSGYSGSIALDDTGTRAAFTDTQIFKGGKFIPFSQ